MKGIILAGGTGSRLYPSTKGISKHLLCVYDKPMIYYPLSVLMLAGIKDILIITCKKYLKNFKDLLGKGERFGIKISYAVQEKPQGLAQSFIIGEKFIGDDKVCLILGDNIFYGQGLSEQLKNAKLQVQQQKGACVFAYHVKNPSEFGIVELDKNNKVISINEKPKKPKSNLALTGLYFYDNQVIKIAKSIKPSKRGELEITDINKIYLEQKKLKINFLGRGFTWLDTGTFDNLLNASLFVKTIEERQGHKISCLEEIAYTKNWIDKEKLDQAIVNNKKNSYGIYLKQIKNGTF